jgi:L-threonylcarbamoyladenylate synthase
MTTKVLQISSTRPDPNIISKVAEILGRGGLVAFPTETVYGLGADAFNVSAVRKVFEAKRRPIDNPLIVHIANFNQLKDIADSIPNKAKILADTFWPGPLTLVLKSSSRVSNLVSANLETVAVRMPDHIVTLALIREFGRGIVGPSANTSGTPSPTKAEHVYDDLNGTIDLILDAGPTDIGVESTIIDLTADPPLILRSGGLPLEQVEGVIGPVEITNDSQILKHSPGTHHRHYAPKASVIVVDVGDVQTYNEILHANSRKQIGCILHSKNLKEVEANNCRIVAVDSLQELSHKLYDTFRLFDQQGVEVILIEAVVEEGIGSAIMDRIRRAAAASVKEQSANAL